jgi:zinc-ribbon domain
MYCPRCGAQNEEGDRYCASCGRPLPGTREARKRRSFREWVGEVVGTTRRTRWITAATVGAIVVAVVAFIALDPAGDEEASDVYVLAADQVCVKAKKKVGKASQRALARNSDGYATDLITIVAGWRADLRELRAPADEADEAQALDDALRDVEIEAGGLARVSRDGDKDAIAEAATRADDSTAQVEQAIADLGLTRCQRVVITPGASPQKGQ